MSTHGRNAFNVETRTWRQLRSLPESGAWHGATTINGKVYVAGGIKVELIDGVPAQRPHQTLYVYDPATGAWTPKADLSTRTDVVQQAGLLGNL